LPVIAGYFRFLPVFSTVLAKILFAMAKTHPCEDIIRRCLVPVAPSTQQWSRLNVGSNRHTETGVNSPTHCWQTPWNGFSNVKFKALCRHHEEMRRVK